MEKQPWENKNEFEILAEHVGKSYTAYQSIKNTIPKYHTEKEREAIALELYGAGTALLNCCALLKNIQPNIPGLAGKLNPEQIEAEVDEAKRFILNQFKTLRERGYGL